jgi:DNA invertase Pin-like site-specific DNA recombinase
MTMAVEAERKKHGTSERTKVALARVRREGSKSGKPIGRPGLDAAIIARIAIMSGTMSAHAIGKTLKIDHKTVMKYLAKRRQPEESY